MAEGTSSSEIAPTPLSRRALMQGSLMLAGVPLCCVTPEAPPEGVAFDGKTLMLNLKLVPGLKSPGGACAVIDLSRKLDIIVARVEKNRFVALDRSCTHGGAQCTYNHKRRSLRCTSLNHAEYDLNGTLLHGRTHGNLRSYTARLNGSTVEVLIAGEKA
ncbi:MAG TPA: Rieske 2Fe-2S domain-containing protein [Bryobacteraceae bacterium]|nr:Rieske 2Fe-2S domain-containing protein [Bryobacteraceae bacterium]